MLRKGLALPPDVSAVNQGLFVWHAIEADEESQLGVGTTCTCCVDFLAHLAKELAPLGVIDGADNPLSRDDALWALEFLDMFSSVE